MKVHSLSDSARQVARALACVVLAASLIALALRAPDIVALHAISFSLPPPLAALLLALLALATLLGSLARTAGRIGGQVSAGVALALTLPTILHEVLPGWLIAAPLSRASAFGFILTAIACIAGAMRERPFGRLFTLTAGAGLAFVSTSLIGLALGSTPLASFGLGAAPHPMTSVLTGIVLVASFAQRGEAGWLQMLLGPSAAGSTARGIIAWTVAAPLAFALIALAGVRAGYYSLHFAFALLAAGMCCGLTVLVVWNAARVDRAQRRAESAREALQLAANRLRLARTATGIQMWEWIPRTREWLSLDGAERLDPSANEYLEAGLTRAERDGKAEFEFALRRPHRDDTGAEERWMLATCWSEQRDVQKVIVGISVDITERKCAVLALETSETRLQLAARALPGFVYDWNCASGKVLRTSGLEQVLGYRDGDIAPVSRWWEDLIHPDDRATALPARVARARAGGEHDSIACEYRVRHRDSRYLWVWDHCVLVRDRAGALVRVVGSVLDITERKEAEARLSVSEHRFKAAVLATTGIFWTHAADGRAVGEQTSWSAFTGRSSDELAGMGWLDAVHPEDAQLTLDAWNKALATGDDLILVHRVRRRDGTYRTFSVHAVPVTGERGEIIEWVGSHTDITKQREAEQRVHESVRGLELALTRRKELESEREGLLAAERAARADLVHAAQAKDEFLATISHELRTPLNAILGWTTLLQRPNADAPMIAEGLKVIERNARAQTQLLGDLLDANQLASGKLSLSFAPMDLNDAVRATLDSMRVTIATRKIRIVSDLCAQPLPVMGDSSRLQQIVSNLLSNALKFTPADGTVTVVTRCDTETTYCEVRDDGEGISTEFLPHIFEKFRQADSGSARRFAGLGLGLAITKQLVESHGGQVSVSSEGRGKGAIFTIRLPRIAPYDAPSTEPGEPASAPLTEKPLAGLCILAVDDETDSREYLERLLTEQGAKIVSVSSAAEALEELAPDTGRFNLLVSDIGMPVATGYDLIRTIRQDMHVDGEELPALALTAFSRREDSARALDKGFQKHIAKPVQVGRLIGAIRQLTGRGETGTRRRVRH